MWGQYSDGNVSLVKSIDNDDVSEMDILEVLRIDDASDEMEVLWLLFDASFDFANEKDELESIDDLHVELPVEYDAADDSLALFLFSIFFIWLPSS